MTLLTYICKHICTVLFLMKSEASEQNTAFQLCLWLAIAFISSTELCVIGYNAALYRRVCLWLSASPRMQIWI